MTNPAEYTLQESSREAGYAGTSVLKLGLASTGAYLVQLVFVMVSSAPLSKSLANVLLLLVAGLVGLLLLASAGLRRPPTSFRWLILLAFLGGLGIRSLIWVQTANPPEFVLTDSALHTEMAGDLLRRGENPYTWDLTGAADLYNDTPIAVTPGLNAASESVYSYPALPFLLAIPLQSLGLPATLLVSIAAHAATLILLFTAAPWSIQPLVLLPVIVMDFISITLVGSMDILWAALLTGMVVAWPKPKLRAMLFGCAASVKQGPWLVALFLLIRIWHDRESDTPLVDVGRFLLIGGMTFLLINAGFIAWNPKAWFQGVTEPLRGDLVFLSHGGLSSLSQFGFARVPKSYYLTATLSMVGLLLFAYWRYYDVLEHAFWIMPGIFMWFSYRSLASYWIYWVFPILATLVTQVELGQVLSGEEDKVATERSAPTGGLLAEKSCTRLGSPGKFTAAAALVTFAALFLTGAFFSLSTPAVEIVPLLPLPTTDGRIRRMSVEVTNHGRRALSPRFAIQSRQTGENPLPWYIDQGPGSLSPGQSATYHISTAEHQSSFLAHDAAQLVVTDAGGNYGYREVFTIGPDDSFLWPDAIPNPAYLFWNDSRTKPIFWDLTTEPSGAGTVSIANKGGRGALGFTLDPVHGRHSRIMLRNRIIFPRAPFGIWVYSGLVQRDQDLSSVAWGLEIDDGQHQLWYLFGTRDYVLPPSGDDQHIVKRVVGPQTWSYQEIDVSADYTKAGWSLPELRSATYRGLETDLRLVDLTLFLIADDLEAEVQTYFGPIEQDDYRVKPHILMEEAFDDPEGHYIRLAASYVEGRNYAKAQKAYRRAYQYSPGTRDIPGGLDGMIWQDAEQGSE